MNFISIGFLKEAEALKEHQRRALEKLEKTPSLLVYHGTGSGKTRLALEASKKFGMPIKAVGPASLRSNFYKERKKHHIRTPVKSYSYNKPPGEVSSNEMLVFDEAHNMGQLSTKRSKLVDKIKGGKTVYLTGTPIRNTPSELIPLMRGLGVRTPRDAKQFNERYIEMKKQYPGFLKMIGMEIRGEPWPTVPKAKHLGELKSLLRGKVDYYRPSMKGYPAVREKTIFVDMSPAQEHAYKIALKQHPSIAYKIKNGISPSKAESSQMNAFLTATRQISNIPGMYNVNSGVADAPKINRAHQEIVSRFHANPEYRGVTYSNYLGHGIKPLAALLEQSGVPYALYTGELSNKEKDAIIKSYNSGEIRQLLISGAGGEGLDLKGTRLMQILEPAWNEPKLEQVKGRAVRYGSHSHLPVHHRDVEIQNFVARPREHGWFFKSREQGTDEYLRTMSKRKADLNNQFLDALQEVGSE